MTRFEVNGSGNVRQGSDKKVRLPSLHFDMFLLMLLLIFFRPSDESHRTANTVFVSALPIRQNVHEHSKSSLYALGRKENGHPMPKTKAPIMQMTKDPANDAIVTSTMVVLDVENIRGSRSFRISHEAMITRIRMWREDRLSKNCKISMLEPIVWVNDHGTSHSIHHFASSSYTYSRSNINAIDWKMPNNIGIVFAGPERTADDVIVELVELRCGVTTNKLRNTTIVITADDKLISRCQQARRQSNSVSDVIFVEPASLLQQLDVYNINSNEEEILFGELPLGRVSISKVARKTEGNTKTMTSFKQSEIAAEQHARFQARFLSKNLSDISGQRNDAQNVSSGDVNAEATSTKSSHNDKNAAAITARLKTEQIRRQLLLSDAFYLARPSKLRGRRTASAMAAIHAKYRNRNISKTQQQRMYAKRLGRKRNEDIAMAAATRKVLAEKLQLNLVNLSQSSDDSGVDQLCNNSRLVKGGEHLLLTLLSWFSECQPATESYGITLCDDHEVETKHDTPTSFSLITGQDDLHDINSNESLDPSGSILRIPLRETKNEDNTITPLRLLVISDTHGFEGALAKFDLHPPDLDHISENYLVPQADILLHCGDFSSSGSRRSQRDAARRLDIFLARQTHIPEKIVLKGNHDPDSPSKVLFPHSKAMYIRTSSTLEVNGVTFAFEPFSKRMSHRNIQLRTNLFELSLPYCDIFVSHEPPKGVLDMTYHGFSAGSTYLRNMVTKAVIKPRLWLCGHIHEGRGILTQRFVPMDQQNDKGSQPTVVINASNANSGKANRLVSGPIVIDVDRNPASKTSGRIFRLRTTNDGNHLTQAGLENMELHMTRPGIRRRKGVPKSVREQRHYQHLPSPTSYGNVANCKSSGMMPKVVN